MKTLNFKIRDSFEFQNILNYSCEDSTCRKARFHEVGLGVTEELVLHGTASHEDILEK